MNKQHPILQPYDVHIWQAYLPDQYAQEDKLLSLLTAEEVERANRFIQPLHKTRFILARGMLRTLLGWYLQLDPKEIVFAYGEHKKPYLQSHHTDLQFNISHSEDMAVFAFRKSFHIGVDIEKIKTIYDDGVANRFFSDEEYMALHALPEKARVPAFYRAWARKEALIKTFGQGLFTPLKEFTVSLTYDAENIVMHFQDKDRYLHLESFGAHPEYQAAFATEDKVENIIVKDYLYLPI